jgi:hypothetical protein
MSLNLKGFVIFSRGLSGGVSPDHRFKKNKKILEDYLQVTGLKKIKKFKKSLQQHRFILQCNNGIEFFYNVITV